jgi:hypothetical protein
MQIGYYIHKGFDRNITPGVLVDIAKVLRSLMHSTVLLLVAVVVQDGNLCKSSIKRPDENSENFSHRLFKKKSGTVG